MNLNKGELIVISLKGNNQSLIALAHNLVFYFKTKQIDIQHHYICNKMAAQRIQLSYIPTNKIISNDLTKALMHIKFHYFIELINM